MLAGDKLILATTICCVSRGERPGIAADARAHVGKGHPRHLCDLFDDDLDAVAVTLDSRYSRESVAKMWPRGSGDIR